VKCIKHMYANAVALEFIILNTLKDQVLENVTVEVDAADVPGVSKISSVPAACIAYSNTESWALLGFRYVGWTLPRKLSQKPYSHQ